MNLEEGKGAKGAKGVTTNNTKCQLVVRPNIKTNCLIGGHLLGTFRNYDNSTVLLFSDAAFTLNSPRTYISPLILISPTIQPCLHSLVGEYIFLAGFT